MRTITVLGNNSGRNAGDNAILGNLLDDFALFRQDIHFRIPSLDPAFIKKHFGRHSVEPMGLMPWNLALKNFGLPLYLAMTRTEMVLITDNILFDRKLHNPFVNYLKSISLFSDGCLKRGIPIVFYNASIGPIDHPAGREALQKVMNASRLVIARDCNTRNLIEKLNISHPEIVINADCALNTPVPSEERMAAIIRQKDLFKGANGTIGMNVNAYIDNWSKPGALTRKDFVRIIGCTVDNLIEKLDVDVLFTVTQVMDLKITDECVQQMKNKDKVRIVTNSEFTYQEIAGLLQRLDIHAGLRTHTLIFCAAVNTPMVNINAYPKSAGFMRTIGQGDWTINFEDLSVENLSQIMLKAWEQRGQTRENMLPLVNVEKNKARNSVRLVSDILDGI
ncbi:MAG: polysaccharide pyruvyl transferase family protein [Desulfoprunum sp.]|jgi:polysaccharide pyruvyl transferase WcaK-like protein|uniref:polysaccharide pyruvyl transferase family protein n=1 Tax=Desulfoprunum sp. TaxID=2020866 RepID=UPI0026A8B41A